MTLSRLDATTVTSNLSTGLPTPAQQAGVMAGFRAALAAAEEKMGVTAPNPAVGCALLDRQGVLLTVGAHPAPGQPHAEVMALREAERLGVMDRVHTALVTLEPCHHHGRTPPCSARLRASPVQAVWIGAADPNPQASGGAAFLARPSEEHPSGQEVFFLCEVAKAMPEYGLLAEECAALLAPFASRVVRGRPWLTVKQALTADGSMIPPAGQTTFTSPESLKLAHRLRRATDALVTGIGTVLADRPSFTVRHVADHAARRDRPRLIVVFDHQNRLPKAWQEAREADGFLVRRCSNTAEMLAHLAEHEANWALVEAGPALLRTLEEEQLWDDWLTLQQAPQQGRDQLTLRLRLDDAPWNHSPVCMLERHLVESASSKNNPLSKNGEMPRVFRNY